MQSYDGFRLIPTFFANFFKTIGDTGDDKRQFGQMGLKLVANGKKTDENARLIDFLHYLCPRFQTGISFNHDDQIHKTGGNMECGVARRGYPAGCGIRCDLLGVVFPERQQLGTMGGDSLPVRHARLVCGINALSFDEASLEMEGATAQMGPCGHLLAHRRFVFAFDTCCPTKRGSKMLTFHYSLFT